jgi:hypothetical protein
MSGRRSRRSESCSMGKPCSRGPGAMPARVSALPPRATAICSPRLGRLGNLDSRSARTYLRTSSACEGRMTPGRFRVVIRRTVPTPRCALCSTARSRKMLSSRLPPPRSIMQRGGASGPNAARTASRPRRDSSVALMTSRDIPDFCLILRRKASRLRASREALVATARYLVTPKSSMISLKWEKAFTDFLKSFSLKRCRRKTPSPKRSG